MLKKKFYFSTLLIISLVILLGISGCKRNSLEQLANERANFMYYGKDEKVDKMLQLEAQAKSWEFYSQDTEYSLIKTGNTDAPFITTVTVTFRNPKDKNILRSLTKTYIFDAQMGLGDWVPLTESVWEYNLKTKGIKYLSSYRLWQGDYDVPFFKD